MNARPHRPALRAGLVALAVGALLLAVLPQTSHYHGDERFYTDAALGMLRSGDWWTPHYADGRPRFLKPILTYWTVAGGFALFGVGLLSSRVLFLAAGCLAVFLTFRLSEVVLGRRPGALTAVLIMGSNIQLLTLASRATPDVLVLLFILASTLGFARIVFRGDRSWTSYALAYGGTGLAVQTKGLLGLCALGAVLLFVLADRRSGRVRPADLFAWKAAGLGLALGGFWYAATVHLHGPAVLRDFFSDQVTAKVSRSPLFAFGNLLTYLWAALRHFLPWSLWAVAAAVLHWRRLRERWGGRRREFLFLAMTFLLLAAAFSGGSARRPRYLVAAYPMLAVILGELLEGIWEDPRLLGWVRGTLAAIAWAALPLAALLAAAGWRIDARLFGAAAMFAALAALLAVSLRRPRGPLLRVAGALPVLVSFLALELFVFPVFRASPARDLAELLAERAAPGAPVYSVGSFGMVAGQIGVLSRGRLNVVHVEETAVPVVETPDTIAIIPEEDVPAWERGGFLATPAAASPSRPSVGEVVRHLREGAPPTRPTRLYLATPPAPRDRRRPDETPR